MPLDNLIESEPDHFHRKDLELAGWIMVALDRDKRTVTNRPSLLAKFFNTVTYAVNPNGVGRLTVRGCRFSEPKGRRQLDCNVELTLSIVDPDLVVETLGHLTRANLDPGAAVETLVKAIGSRVQM